MLTLSRTEARQRMIGHLGLARSLGRGARGTRAVLERLRCIQLDPLDVIGTNADLVVMARTEGVARGDVWRQLFPRHAFEHFFNQRCILPASSFPWYRTQGHAAEVSWWQHRERERRVAPAVLEAVLEELRVHGPRTARDLTDHGSVDPLDWAGWMGTGKATTMALEMLWTQCDVVVAGRTESGAKIYDVPERTFGEQPPANGDFARWLLRERARAAGLLKAAAGRRTPEHDLVEVMIEGSSRRFLALPEFLDAKRPRYDDKVRILGPLDPLLWDRQLVRHLFDFDYVWEVYKPAHQRKWGWYVCPLLQRDRFIGRIDARIEKNKMIVTKIWLEDAGADRDAIRAALERHAERCGATRVVVRRWSSSG